MFTVSVPVRSELAEAAQHLRRGTQQTNTLVRLFHYKQAMSIYVKHANRLGVFARHYGNDPVFKAFEKALKNSIRRLERQIAKTQQAAITF